MSLEHWSKKTDISSFVTAWKKKIKNQELWAERQREQAKKDAERISIMLSQDFGVSKVILFGSTAVPWKGYQDTSDIDLAVVSLPAEKYYKALAATSKLTNFSVDIIDYDFCSPGLRRAIKRDGVVLYDKKGNTAKTGSRNQ